MTVIQTSNSPHINRCICSNSLQHIKNYTSLKKHRPVLSLSDKSADLQHSAQVVWQKISGSQPAQTHLSNGCPGRKAWCELLPGSPGWTYTAVQCQSCKIRLTKLNDSYKKKRHVSPLHMPFPNTAASNKKIYWLPSFVTLTFSSNYNIPISVDMDARSTKIGHLSCGLRVLLKVNGLVFHYSKDPYTVSAHNKCLLTGMPSCHSQYTASARQS